MGEYKVLLVKPEDIHRVWNGIKPIIQTSLDTMQKSQGIEYLIPEDYKTLLERNLAQFFMTVKNGDIKIIAITQVSPYPRFSVLKWLLCGGKELKYCYKILTDKIEDFAHMQECRYMIINGRKGLKRSLEALGWGEIKTTHQINLIKEL